MTTPGRDPRAHTTPDRASPAGRTRQDEVVLDPYVTELPTIRRPFTIKLPTDSHTPVGIFLHAQ